MSGRELTGFIKCLDYQLGADPVSMLRIDWDGRLYNIMKLFTKMMVLPVEVLVIMIKMV